MYSKMWGNIDRHIHVVWQSVGVLAGSITALILVDKEVFSLDIAVTLVVMVGVWQMAHVMDASWWFNRNLHIIRNIERQFMNSRDASDIHYYFAEPPKKTMLDHQRIQLWFGIAVTGVVLGYHFLMRVIPGFSSSLAHFDAVRGMPYLALVCGVGALWRLYKHHLKAFNSLTEKSPGQENL